jgi:hypothetical protein
MWVLFAKAINSKPQAILLYFFGSTPSPKLSREPTSFFFVLQAESKGGGGAKYKKGEINMGIFR